MVWISSALRNTLFFINIFNSRQKGDPKVLGGALPADNQYLRLNNIPCRCRSRDIESIQKEIAIDDECLAIGEDIPETAPPAASSAAGDDEEEEEFYSFTDGDASVFTLLSSRLFILLLSIGCCTYLLYH